MVGPSLLTRKVSRICSIDIITNVQGMIFTNCLNRTKGADNSLFLGLYLCFLEQLKNNRPSVSWTT